MLLKKIKIVQYKNISNLGFEPHSSINAFTGFNGMGKTNILDSIHYLCLAKSNFGRLENNNVMKGQDFFRLEGEFEKNSDLINVTIKVKPPRVKVIQKNGKDLDKISDHIGDFPVVIITPKDKNSLLENSIERRKLMDRVMSQTDRMYLEKLVEYNKWLKQRNALLKISDIDRYDNLLLDTFDGKMEPLAEYIFEKRKDFIIKIAPRLSEIYKRISDGAEYPSIEYKSQLESKKYTELVKENLKKDLILKRSNAGIHKDDLIFSLDDMNLKLFASQGQLKSFALSVKLAEFTFLKEQKGYIPIVILDDVFDKLDNKRVKYLVSLLFDNGFGQVFISDTDKERVKKIFEDSNVDYKLFEVQNGNIINEYTST